MIKTKSVYHDPIDPGDGYRLLVMRHWPRGIRKAHVDGWLRDLGPSQSLLSAVRADRVDWETFSTLYRQEVSETERGRDHLDEVKRLEGEHGTVTLLCHEDLRNSDSHCHREILKEMLGSRARDVRAVGRVR